MNLANKLTLGRILIIPFFLVALIPASFGLPAAWGLWLHPLALVLFFGAALTDYYDGMLARRHGWVSNFGKLMDPLADKILIMAALVGLVELRIFPAWMVVIILAREFLITGLRLVASAQGKVLAADRWGKNKTISQIVTIVAALVYLTLYDWLMWAGMWEQLHVGRLPVGTALHWVLYLLMFCCVVMTVASGWRYCRVNLDLINTR